LAYVVLPEFGGRRMNITPVNRLGMSTYGGALGLLRKVFDEEVSYFQQSRRVIFESFGKGSDLSCPSDGNGTESNLEGNLVEITRDKRESSRGGAVVQTSSLKYVEEYFWRQLHDVEGTEK
jgi:hypothetical protein